MLHYEIWLTMLEIDSRKEVDDLSNVGQQQSFPPPQHCVFPDLHFSLELFCRGRIYLLYRGQKKAAGMKGIRELLDSVSHVVRSLFSGQN